MIQEIDNPEDHYGPNEFEVYKDTHLYKAIGKKTSMRGVCYHHQNVKDVPDWLVVNSIDKGDGTIHGLEYPVSKRKCVMSVLWHPEEVMLRPEFKDNHKIMKYFISQAKEYQKERLRVDN